MGERRQRGGYGGEDFLSLSSGTSFGNDNSFGQDYQSLGSDGNSGTSFAPRLKWWQRGRHAPAQMQRISGTRRSHLSYMEGRGGGGNNDGSNFRGTNHRGSNFRDSNQSNQQDRGGSSRGGGSGHRGGRQGPKKPKPQYTIADYYSRSMMGNPWRDLETLFKVPNMDCESSVSEPTENVNKEADNSDQEVNHPIMDCESSVSEPMENVNKEADNSDQEVNHSDKNENDN